MSRGLYRRHSPRFKLQLSTDIRAGAISRREAQRSYQLSANLIQLWLGQYNRGELNVEEVEASVIDEYKAKIAALERKVGRLTMEIDLLKKTPQRVPETTSEPVPGGLLFGIFVVPTQVL